MRQEQLILDFLTKHHKADEIVWDTEANLPHKAVYRTMGGAPREHVAVYYFSAGTD